MHSKYRNDPDQGDLFSYAKNAEEAEQKRAAAERVRSRYSPSKEDLGSYVEKRVVVGERLGLRAVRVTLCIVQTVPKLFFRLYVHGDRQHPSMLFASGTGPLHQWATITSMRGPWPSTVRRQDVGRFAKRILSYYFKHLIGNSCGKGKTPTISQLDYESQLICPTVVRQAHLKERRKSGVRYLVNPTIVNPTLLAEANPKLFRDMVMHVLFLRDVIRRYADGYDFYEVGSFAGWKKAVLEEMLGGDDGEYARATREGVPYEHLERFLNLNPVATTVDGLMKALQIDRITPLKWD